MLHCLLMKGTEEVISKAALCLMELNSQYVPQTIFLPMLIFI